MESFLGRLRGQVQRSLPDWPPYADNKAARQGTGGGVPRGMLGKAGSEVIWREKLQEANPGFFQLPSHSWLRKMLEDEESG